MPSRINKKTGPSVYHRYLNLLKKEKDQDTRQYARLTFDTYLKKLKNKNRKTAVVAPPASPGESKSTTVINLADLGSTPEFEEVKKIMRTGARWPHGNPLKQLEQFSKYGRKGRVNQREPLTFKLEKGGKKTRRRKKRGDRVRKKEKYAKEKQEKDFNIIHM